MDNSVVKERGYNVVLDVFEGPLDLLLYLVKKNDMDIYDIEISRITADYFAYVEVLQELNLENAGEFLVAASTLMQIKVKILLPRVDEEEDEALDPRTELVNRLLEHQRYKEAAKLLEQRAQTAQDLFYRSAPVFEECDLSIKATVWDLLDTYREVLENAGDEIKEIAVEDEPIEVKMQNILEMLNVRKSVFFRDLLMMQKSMRSMITMFIALLELIRLYRVVARQDEFFSEIVLVERLER